MVKITVEEFAEKYIASNKGINLEDISNNLREAVIRKKSGIKCSCCNVNRIWAIGSAISGFDGCFTCTTGETDDSDDYEVY